MKGAEVRYHTRKQVSMMGKWRLAGKHDVRRVTYDVRHSDNMRGLKKKYATFYSAKYLGLEKQDVNGPYGSFTFQILAPVKHGEISVP